MDQKQTEGKMLAITDGEAAESRGTSSYVMLPSDRKAVAETRSSASNSEVQISNEQISFENKGWWGLWWDGKGIFNSSNKKDVMEHMEKHKEFYKAVVTFTVMVEKGDTKSYKFLLDLYEKLSEMELEAERDAKNSKSKAICRMLRNFLQDKYQLDHNLKKVECVVLKQKIEDVEQACERSREAVDSIGQKMNKVLEENREIKMYMRESQERAKELQAENKMCRNLVERVSKEKDELKVAMERKMDEISLEADRRAEEANERSEARVQRMAEQNKCELQKMAEQNKRELQKMAEQSKRELQKIMEMLASMKNNFP